MTIALDAMGGDLGVSETVKGAVLALREFHQKIILVGDEKQLLEELRKDSRNVISLEIVHAPKFIPMDEKDVISAVRRDADLSINVAMKLVKEGRAQGVVSTANSGAVVTSAFTNLRRIEGLKAPPAIALLLPLRSGKVLVLDVGANPDCTASNLLDFGRMGVCYMEKVLGIAHPRVGLLSNGEEGGKGKEVTKEALPLLEASGLNFVGNIEGTDVYTNKVNVVVTDGFTGNVALKACEGLSEYITAQIREGAYSTWYYKLAAMVLKPMLKDRLGHLDYAQSGGANLLGVKGVVTIAHGRSNAEAVKNALLVNDRGIRSNYVQSLQETFAAKSAPQAIGT